MGQNAGKMWQQNLSKSKVNKTKVMKKKIKLQITIYMETVTLTKTSIGWMIKHRWADYWLEPGASIGLKMLF